MHERSPARAIGIITGAEAVGCSTRVQASCVGNVGKMPLVPLGVISGGITRAAGARAKGRILDGDVR